MPEASIVSHEREIEFSAILDEIDPQLHINPSATKANICRLLGREPRPFDMQDCVDRTRSALEDVVIEEIQDGKYRLSTAACDQITDAPPPAAESELETPNAYIKRRRLSSSIRPQLRQVRAQTIANARDNLSAKISQDTYHDDCVDDIDDEELRTSITAYRNEAARDVAVAVAEIKRIRPDAMSIRHKVGSLALRALRLDPSLLDIPAPAFSKEQDKALEEAMLQLRDALTRRKQSPEAVANAISEQYRQMVADGVGRRMEGHYKELVADTLDLLPVELENAYSQAASIGPEYRPRPERPASLEEAVQTELHPEADSPQPAEARSLGEVENPFDWLPDSTVELSVLDDGCQQLLFCEAMHPVAKELSSGLRTDLKVDRKFDSLWAKIKDAEHKGNSLGHGRIRITHQKFEDLTVYYFRSNGASAYRSYYTKTNVGRFPSLAGKASEAGISPDTNVLILLAETDKSHQAKVFKTYKLGRHLPRNDS
jgi:hypothetical protein